MTCQGFQISMCFLIPRCLSSSVNPKALMVLLLVVLCFSESILATMMPCCNWNFLKRFGCIQHGLTAKVGSSWNMAIHLHRWEQTNHLFWTLKCKRCKRKLLAIWIWGQKPISNSQHQNSDFGLSKLWILEDLYQHAGRDVCDFHCQSSVLAATKQDGGSGWLSNPKGKPALIYLTILICLLFLTNLRNNWNNYECG